MFEALSILKLGEEAGSGPLTLIVYVPAVRKLSKSSAYTSGKLRLQEPTVGPIAVGPKTVVPAEFLITNVAPVSALGAIRYPRFEAPDGYPTWFTRTKALCAKVAYVNARTASAAIAIGFGRTGSQHLMAVISTSIKWFNKA